MRYFIISAFILFCSVLSAQIKKKDLGSYTGSIATYKINNGVELIQVKESEIQIVLTEESLNLKIGNVEYEAPYKANKQGRRTYEIQATITFSDIEERITLYGKEKRMVRKGLFPQPDATLEKLPKEAALN